MCDRVITLIQLLGRYSWFYVSHLQRNHTIGLPLQIGVENNIERFCFIFENFM